MAVLATSMNIATRNNMEDMIRDITKLAEALTKTLTLTSALAERVINLEEKVEALEEKLI